MSAATEDHIAQIQIRTEWHDYSRTTRDEAIRWASRDVEGRCRVTRDLAAGHDPWQQVTSSWQRDMRVAAEAPPSDEH